jgi:2-aminobenzoylacetyl-CoA thioesterase
MKGSNKMMKKRQDPIAITSNFYQLGTPSFPVYLSVGENAMIIEGGTGSTYNLIVEQISELGIDPLRIKYVALTHTHSDHIGAIPHLKKLWPHLKIAGSPLAAKLLKSERAAKEFLAVDRSIAQILLNKGELATLPIQIEDYAFNVDQVIEEGDKIDLGDGIVWTVYDTPGHSACHISFFEEKEKTLMVGDATGFYVPGRDVFWPNYFESLEAYCKSIRKLSALSANRAALCHNGVVEGHVAAFLCKAIEATDRYHHEMIRRINAGEDHGQIAIEKGNWVNTLTDIQTLQVMQRLAKVLISKSHTEAHKENLFSVPVLIK